LRSTALGAFMQDQNSKKKFENPKRFKIHPKIAPRILKPKPTSV